MADELARWAATRARDLIARAEAEAVAELKAALLHAASGGAHRTVERAHEQAPPSEEALAAPAAEPSETGTLVWAYCVERAGDPVPTGLPGLGSDVERIEHDGLAALISHVPAAEYGEEVLPGSLNDLPWLESVARAHETVLERAGQHATIVPLRLCTIFVDAAGVRRMLGENRPALEAALDRLDGRQEWAVKLLFDAENTTAESKTHDPSGDFGTGTAYLLERRAEREARAAAERLGRELAEDVHARLQDWAIDAVVNPPQSRQLSGHAGDMLLNGAYLVEADRADELRLLVSELQERHHGAGARLELAGPLPPFNFVAQPGTES